MGQTLTNGIYLPAEGERNCYTGLAANWTALDGLIGGYNAHIGNTTIHVTVAEKTLWNTVSGKADSSALTAHTGDTTIHVTAADKTLWNTVSDKANDPDVMHKTGAETVAGPKTFSSDVNVYNSDISGVTPNLNIRSSIIEKGDTSTADNLRILFLDKYNRYVGVINANKNAMGTQYLSLSIRTTDTSNNDIVSTINYYLSKSGDRYFSPYEDNLINLGSSVRRWKTFNGLTPSSLSLPSYSAAKIDISGYVTDLTGGNNNYTAPANGYIFVRTANGTYLKLMEYPSGVCSSVCSQTADDIGTFIPVIANRVCIISIKCTSIDRAYFIPCLGNI